MHFNINKNNNINCNCFSIFLVKMIKYLEINIDSNLKLTYIITTIEKLDYCYINLK